MYTDTELNKSESERQITYDITYVWNLKYGTNEPFHRKENHGHREQTCDCQGGGGGTGNLGIMGAKCFLGNG